MNRQGAAFDFFATVSGFDELVVGPTDARGGTLDLLMTDVPDLVRVTVAAPVGNPDHSSKSAVISMAQAVPNLCVSRKIFLKHQVNWCAFSGVLPTTQFSYRKGLGTCDALWCVSRRLQSALESGQEAGIM